MLKVNFIFNQFQSGWTETWYIPQDDPEGFVQGLSLSVVNAALAMRAKGTEMYAVRASLVNTNTKKSAIRLLRVAAPDPGGSPGYFNPDVVSTDLQIQLKGATGKKRLLALRGLRDADVVRDPATGGSVPSGLLTTQWQNYLGFMIGLFAGIQSTKRFPDAGVTPTRVVSVKADALTPNLSAVTVQDDIVGVGNLPFPVSFLGIPKDDLPGFPATVTVLSKSVAAPWVYTINYRYRGSAVTTFPPKMTISQLARDYTSIAGYIFLRFSERKTGKPFGELRGRSRVAVRRQ